MTDTEAGRNGPPDGERDPNGSLDGDAELRAMAAHVFRDERPEPGIDRERLANPEPQSPNVVPREGTNPDGPIDDDAYERDFTKRMFDPAYAATQQELPEQ